MFRLDDKYVKQCQWHLLGHEVSFKIQVARWICQLLNVILSIHCHPTPSNVLHHAGKIWTEKNWWVNIAHAFFQHHIVERQLASAACKVITIDYRIAVCAWAVRMVNGKLTSLNGSLPQPASENFVTMLLGMTLRKLVANICRLWWQKHLAWLYFVYSKSH